MIARLNHIDSYDFSRQGHIPVHTCIPLEVFCKYAMTPFTAKLNAMVLFQGLDTE